MLAVLLVLLLAGVGFLWFTRPATSAVRTSDYVGALQAARSGVVDMTSFDYLTLDDDIAQIKRVTTGDLQKEAVDQLDSRRKQITDSQAVVNTEVVGAGSPGPTPTAPPCCWSSSRPRRAARASRPRSCATGIQVELEKKNGRWLLSGIAGTGTGGNGDARRTTPDDRPRPTPRPRPGGAARGPAPRRASPAAGASATRPPRAALRRQPAPATARPVRNAARRPEPVAAATLVRAPRGPTAATAATAPAGPPACSSSSWRCSASSRPPAAGCSSGSG